MRRLLRVACIAVPGMGLLAGGATSGSAAWLRLPAKSTLPQQFQAIMPIAVFGKDDRVTLPRKYRDVKGAVGLLFNNRSRTVCTAFCVAPDVIATASHCLFRTRGQRRPSLSHFWFARNYGKRKRDYARVFGHARGAAEQHITAGDTRLRVRPPIGATRDWALVRLERPACRKHVLAMNPISSKQIIREANAKRIFQVSYHRDFANWRMAYSTPCAVARRFGKFAWSTIHRDFRDPNALLLHQCDTGGASSGSPLLRQGSDGVEVVGINVGTYVQSRVVMQNGRVTHRYKADTVANTGVTIVALSRRLKIFQDAHILSASDKVKALQTYLKARKLYGGAIDGDYGPATRAAIEAYEKAEKLPITGLASEHLLQHLSTNPPQAARPLEASQTPTFTPAQSKSH